MTISVLDHVAELQTYDRGFLAKKPIRSAIREIIGEELNLVENLLHDMIAALPLDDAAGVQLDLIYGPIARVERLGRTDDEFRRVIRIAIRANDSDGGIEDMIFVTSGLVGEVVRYQLISPGNFQLVYETDTALAQVFLDEALELIGRAAPGGVSWVIIEVSPKGQGKDFDGGPDGQGFQDYRFARIIGSSYV